MSIASYTTRAQRGIVQCSLVSCKEFRLRDAGSWEFFSIAQLPKYIEDNLEGFQAYLEKLSDLSEPVNEQQEKELYFMLESLLQAKRLLQEMNAKRQVIVQ